MTARLSRPAYLSYKRAGPRKEGRRNRLNGIFQQRQDRFLAGAERSQPHHERNSKQKQKQEPVGPNIHNNGPAAAVGVVVRRELVFVFFYFFLDCE